MFHWFWTGISVAEHYIDTIRRFSPCTRVAVLTDDQHGLREERLAQVSGLLSDHLRAVNLRQREREVYSSADLVLGISEADIRGITAMVPGVKTGLLTMTTDIAPVEKQFEEREGVLFIGDFANRTTVDSAVWLLQGIWPEVRKRLPEATLYLAGNLSETLTLEIPAGVQVLGYVEDLGRYTRSAESLRHPFAVARESKPKYWDPSGTVFPR